MEFTYHFALHFTDSQIQISVRHNSFSTSQVSVRWPIRYVNARMWSTCGTTTTLVSNGTLLFAVGKLSFYTSCRKGSGIQVNVSKQTNSIYKKVKIIDAIKYCTNTHAELKYLQTKEEENE
jgi:hypothetical protein